MISTFLTYSTSSTGRLREGSLFNTFSFPPSFSRMQLTETNIRSNISERSYERATEMFNKGRSHIIGNPVTEGKNVVTWVVRSQSDCLQTYKVSVHRNTLATFGNKREQFKNFKYSCSCDDLKVRVQSLVHLSNQSSCPNLISNTKGITFNWFYCIKVSQLMDIKMAWIFESGVLDDIA